MNTSNKDKRTKEQLLQVLSNALTQEELLGEKIKTLETQLAACQKQQEDAQAEMSQYGVSASKESFRIDYYKTSGNGRLKGIIEHLPSRQKKSLQGLGIKHIAQFVEHFLPDEAKQQKQGPAAVEMPKATPPVLPVVAANVSETIENVVVQSTTPSTNLNQLRAEMAAIKRATQPPIQQAERKVAGENTPSRLAQRLRSQWQSEQPKTKEQLVNMLQAAANNQTSQGQTPQKNTARPVENKPVLPRAAVAAQPPVADQSRLSERLRAEFRTELPNIKRP